MSSSSRVSFNMAFGLVWQVFVCGGRRIIAALSAWLLPPCRHRRTLHASFGEKITHHVHLTSQNQHPFFAIGFKQYHTSESRSASSIGKRRILSLCSQADPSLFVHINLSTHLCSHYNPSTPFAPFPNWKTEKYNIVK